MRNPKSIETVIKGATYRLPKYKITNEGIEDAGTVDIELCKGDKANALSRRQDGTFTESHLQMCLEYLQEVNVGVMASRETSMAITKIDEALMWLAKRAEDRKLRGVQGAYKK